MEDRAIVELYFERNEQAIAETERKYGKLCHMIAKRIVGNEHDAEECVNDTYLGLWQAIPPERPRSLAAFAAKIARNLAIGRLKYNTAAKRNSQADMSIHELEELLPDAAAYEDIEDRVIGEWISEFLRGEREEVRNIFIRKYFYFDSVEDIAEHFGHSESKVKSILFRTRNKLREFLTEKGVAL